RNVFRRGFGCAEPRGAAAAIETANNSAETALRIEPTSIRGLPGKALDPPPAPVSGQSRCKEHSGRSHQRLFARVRILPAFRVEKNAFGSFHKQEIDRGCSGDK